MTKMFPKDFICLNIEVSKLIDALRKVKLLNSMLSTKKEKFDSVSFLEKKCFQFIAFSHFFFKLLEEKELKNKKVIANCSVRKGCISKKVVKKFPSE